MRHFLFELERPVRPFRRSVLGGLGAMLVSVCVCPWSLADSPPPIEAYGKLPSIEAPRLAQDGSAIAYLSSVEGRRCLLIRRLDKVGADQRAICPGEYEVRSFAWKTPDRLIVEVYTQAHSHGAELRTESRLLALDLNGRSAVPLVVLRLKCAVTVLV